jgi:adenine-specific DNA-methyltransferase
MPIGPYFADFACFAEKLIVELDGGQHANAAPYDERRTRFIESQGYRVLRFWNNEVLTNSAGVLQVIADALARGGAFQ